MTEEEKDIIYKDACCRLPYHPYAAYTLKDGTMINVQLTGADDGQYYGYNSDTWGHIPDYDVKLYLRPLSSMTEEELDELKNYTGLLYDNLDLASFQNGVYKCLDFYLSEVPADVVIKVFDWLHMHHFDYRGLVSMGLALEAPKEMYKQKYYGRKI